MIPLPDAYALIEKELTADTITGQEASDRVHAARGKLGPPWQWKSWKKARLQILGSSCETCGEGQESVTLVLQHTVKLPHLGRFVEQVKYDSDYHEELALKRAEIEAEATPQSRPCCPKCESTAIVYRKRAATWICNGKVRKRFCHHEFEAPRTTLALTPQQKRDLSRRKADSWQTLRDSRKDAWLREGILLWFQHLRRYLSLVDTKTLCKRCAFLEDKTYLKPCLSCGLAFPRHLSDCPDCGAGPEHESA